MVLYKELPIDAVIPAIWSNASSELHYNTPAFGEGNNIKKIKLAFYIESAANADNPTLLKLWWDSPPFGDSTDIIWNNPVNGWNYFELEVDVAQASIGSIIQLEFTGGGSWEFGLDFRTFENNGELQLITDTPASLKTTLAEYTTRAPNPPPVIQAFEGVLRFEDGGRGDGNIIEGILRIKVSAFTVPIKLNLTFGSGVPQVIVSITNETGVIGWNEFTFTGEDISKEGNVLVIADGATEGSLTLDLENGVLPELILKRLTTGTTTIQGVQSITF